MPPTEAIAFRRLATSAAGRAEPVRRAEEDGKDAQIPAANGFKTLIGNTAQELRDDLERSSAPAEHNVGLRLLLNMVRPELPLLSIAVGSQIVSSVTSMMFPLATGKIVDIANSHGPTAAAELHTLALGLGAMFTISCVAMGVRAAVMSIASERISRDLRKRLFVSVMGQDMKFFDFRQSGELVNRLSSDAQAVSGALTDNLARLVRSSVTTMSSLGFMVYLNPHLATVTTLLVPPVAGIAFTFGRLVRAQSKRLTDDLAAATQVASERISGIRTVRSFAAEDFEIGRYSDRLNHTYSTARRIAVTEGLYIASAFFITQWALVGLLWYGGNMVIAGHLSVGNLTSFLMYGVNLGISCSNLATAYGHLSRAQGAAFRIFEVLQAEKSGNNRGSAVLQPGYDRTVKFENVSFSYPTRPDVPILRNLNLTFSPGEIVALAGASGSGKSSVLALLLALYPQDGGSITLGGHDLASLDVKWLRHQIGIVEQRPVLFDGTVFDNIAYGLDEDVEDTAEKVREAARLSTADELIEVLPEKYETRVGERGQSLSGGQVQRIALARALLRNPKILALDEATSALDAPNAAAVSRAIDRITRERDLSVVLVSHRMSTLRRADRILVLHNGAIAQEGTYNTLVENDGLFREMSRASRFDGKREPA